MPWFDPFGIAIGVILLENNKKISERTLDELLETGIDDILNDLPELNIPFAPNPADEELSAKDTAKLAGHTEEKDARHPRKSQNDGKKETAPGATLLTYLHDIAYLLAGLVLVFLLLFRVVVVSGTSMNNTLLDGDYLLLLSSTFYQEPKYGDVIVASKESFDNGAPIVKRVIATEGQMVDINFETGIVYVNDIPLEEEYTLTLTSEVYKTISFPLIVDEGCIFVMGDNRDGSKDSRHPDIGLIDKREVLGKVFFLFYPGTNHDEFERDYGRIGVVD